MADELTRKNIVWQLMVEGNAKSELNTIKGKTEEAEKSVNSVTKSLGRAAKAFAVFVAARGAGRLISEGIKLAKTYEQTAVSFEVFTGSAQGARDILNELEKFSLRTPFSPKQVQDAAKTLLGFGRSTKDVISDLDILGNVAAATNTDINQLGLVFGQVAGVGKLQGQDALQFINAGIPLYQLLSESIGVSVAEVKELQEQGKITFDVLREAFVDASAEGGKFAGALLKQSQTIGGLFSTLKGIGETTLRELGNAFLPLLKTILPPLINFGFRLIDVFKEVARFAEPFTSILVDGLRPLGLALGRLFSSIRQGLGGVNLIQSAFTKVAQTLTFLANVATIVVGGLTDLFEFFRTGDSVIAKGIVLGVTNLGRALSNLPAIANGIVESFSVAFQNIENFAARTVIRSRILIEEAKRLIGRGNQDIIDNLEAQINSGLFNNQSVLDAFQRGFDAIANIEVKPPKIDTAENLAQSFDEGTEIGKRITKGIKEEVKKIADIVLQEIGAIRSTELQQEIDAIASVLAGVADLGASGEISLQLENELNKIVAILSDINGASEKALDDRNASIEEKFKAFAERSQAELVKSFEAGESPKSFLERLGFDEKTQRELQEAIKLASDSIGQLFDEQEERITRDVELQRSRVDELRDLGRDNTDETLRNEQERLDGLLEQQAQAQERQEALAAAEIATQKALAVAKTAAGLADAISKPFPANLVAFPLVLALIAQIAGAANGIGGLFQGFKDGTDYVNGPGTSRSDSIFARLSKGEGVVDAQTNNLRLRAGLNNENLAALSGLMLTNGFSIPLLKQEIVSGYSRTDNEAQSNSSLVKEVRKLQKINQALLNKREKGYMDKKAMRTLANRIQGQEFRKRLS